MERFNIATDSKTDEKFTIVDGDTHISVFTDVFTGNRYAAGKYRVYRELNASLCSQKKARSSRCIRTSKTTAFLPKRSWMS